MRVYIHRPNTKLQKNMAKESPELKQELESVANTQTPEDAVSIIEKNTQEVGQVVEKDDKDDRKDNSVADSKKEKKQKSTASKD